MPQEVLQPTDAVRRRMQATRREHTPAELAVRSALHRRGLRFRVQEAVADVARVRPDIVFPKQRVAVFVDGCFWHQCPQHGSMPKRNSAWWAEKLAGNVARDRRHDVALQEAGWTVVRVWEHENVEIAALEVQRVVLHPQCDKKPSDDPDPQVK